MTSDPRHQQFMRLFLSCQPWMFAFIRSLVFSRTDADDVLQEVSFLDQFYLRPRTITVTDGATGAPLDLFNRSSTTPVGSDDLAAPLLDLKSVPRDAADALEMSKLTFIDRGAKAEKEYLRRLPSLNASFGLRDDLIVRAAHYYSVGRPNFNQYAGGVTLPDTELPPNPTNDRIVVSNVGIKAWSSTTSNVRLEYYFQGVSQVSVSAFHRDDENFFGSTTFAATPEFLSDYDLDPEVYGDYPVATQYNLTTRLRTTGVSFNYKQALTFLPNWARGVQVFANLRNLHDATEDFEIAGPSMPEHAQFDRRIAYGSRWTFGVKGTF